MRSHRHAHAVGFAVAAVGLAGVLPAGAGAHETFGAIGDPIAGLGASYVVAPSPAGPATASAAAISARSYGGHTSKNAPISFRVAAGGRQLTEAAIQARASCESGMTFPVATVMRRGAKPGEGPGLTGGRVRSGQFKASSVAGADLGDNVGVISIGMRGKLGALRSSGALLVHVDVVDKTSQQRVDSCDTGAVGWSGRIPERRVYAGASEQRFPIVIELTRSRGAVRTFWFGIFASCSPEGAIEPAQGVTNFPIRSGRFGDEFSMQDDDGSGGTLRVNYALRGSIGRRAASGTLSIETTQRDANGNVVSSCQSGTVDWKTRQ